MVHGLVLGLLLTTQGAQPQTLTCMGKLSTEAGLPWSGAEVLFEQALAPESETVVLNRPIVVRSDKRGRFRVHLQANRRYLAYARSRAGTQETWRFSTMASFYPTKRILRLRALPELRDQIQLRTIGLEAFEKEWKEEGPLQYRIQSSDGMVRQLNLSTTRPTLLPAWPGESAEIQVLDAKGQILYRYGFPLDREDRSLRSEDLAARKEQQSITGRPFLKGLPEGSLLPTQDQEWFVLPPALTLAIQVRDKQADKMLAGVQVLQHSSSRFAGRPRSFRTDEQGRIQLRVPYSIFPWGQHAYPSIFNFLVRAKGLEHTVAHFEFREGRSRSCFASERLFSSKAPEIICALDKGLRFLGQLTLPDGYDGSNIPIRAWSSGPLARSDDWVAFVRQPSQYLKPNKDGSFVVEGLGSDPESIRIDILLPAGLRKRLGSHQEEGIPTQKGLSLRIDRLRNLERDQVDKGLDLSSMRYVDLIVRNARRQPASFALVDLEIDTQRLRASRVQRYLDRTRIQCDRRGRCRILLPAGSFRLLVVTDSDYGYRQRVGHHDLPASPWRIQLVPKASMLGQVVSDEGRAISGAWIYKIDSFRRPSESGLPHGYEGITDANAESLQARTDSEGRFLLRYIPVQNLAWRMAATMGFPRQGLTGAGFQVPSKEATKAVKIILKTQH